MLRIVFFVIILAHGFIHLLGFLKAFGWSDLDQLHQPVSKPVGALWLTTTLLFIFTATTFLLKKEWWWMAALPAVICSQILIILSWQDARFGTILNLIVFIISLLSYGDWNFSKTIDKSVKALVPTTLTSGRLVTVEMLDELPPLIRTWLFRSQIQGTPVPQWGQLQQTGEMKIKPGARWMGVASRQWILNEPAGFIWKARVGQDTWMQFSGKDIYFNGKGQMNILLYSLVPVVQATGSTIDEGALVRYLAEVVWFPWAVLSRNMQFETLSESSVKATFRDGGLTVSGIFTFNDHGDVIKFEALRYFYRKSGSTREKWVVTIDEHSYQEFGGIRIPARSTVSWELEGEEFTWYRVHVKDAHYY